MKTKRVKQNVLLFMIIYLAIGISLSAQEKQTKEFPTRIPFNGVLTDKSGDALSDGFYDFTFSFYTSPKSGSPVWEETHRNVPVINGEFNVTLGGSSETKPANLLFDKKYYIGIKINDEPEMNERLELVSVPYSLGAKYADDVSDGSITTEKLADGSVTNEKIKSVSINKVINIPPSLGSIAKLKTLPQIMGSDYEWWTTQGNLIYGPERHFLGVRNDRNFVIQTWEVQRMLFDPFGYIVLGMVTDSVDFHVIGFSTFDYVFVKGTLGVGIDPPQAKMHVNAPIGKTPFLVDYEGSNIFSIDTQGRVVITTTLSGEDNTTDSYPLYIHGGEHGIAIRIDGDSNGDHNYMSFWDDGGMVGRIEGQDAADYFSEPASIATDVYMAALIAGEIVAAVSWLYPLPIPTEPADIIAIAADIAEITFVTIWETTHLGVTYESGGGDYAEWLERLNPDENISAGDIVAVNGGKISKNTSTGEQFMAVSAKPIILGNAPKEDKKENYETVAFMGQIPVKVRGKVNCGDYIIPSGLNDGTGIAIAPELMTSDEFSRVIGKAWSASSGDNVSFVNVHIGVGTQDVGYFMKRSKRSDEKISTNMAKIDKNLREVKAASKKLNNKLTNAKNSLNEILSKFKETQLYFTSEKN
ncbi:MAG: hypothetical protein GXO87_05390 [Chlorobi bacterium]|nr:hypothetical protein [Chlorobiota bacterium]